MTHKLLKCLVALLFISAFVLLLNQIHNKYTANLFNHRNFVCSKCKGTREFSIDLNKINMNDSLMLFIKQHPVKTCKKCITLPEGRGYVYCEEVNQYYATLFRQYTVAGPKMKKIKCDECMAIDTLTIDNSNN